MSSDKSNQLLIREAIRKIALGRSMERISLAPGGMSGIGTARMIHGYVAKIHDDPSDEEFSDYGGTIDVGEYPDETASAELVIHKGVLLSAATNSEGGFLIVPTLFSDVTIFMDAAKKRKYEKKYLFRVVTGTEFHLLPKRKSRTCLAGLGQLNHYGIAQSRRRNRRLLHANDRRPAPLFLRQ